MSGGNGSAANLTPIDDIKLETTALLLNYQLNDNLSLMGGMTNNSLNDSTVQTLAGSYTIPGATEQGYIVGAAYSVPEIALRAELIYQPKTKLKLLQILQELELSITHLLIIQPHNHLCHYPIFTHFHFKLELQRIHY